MGGADLKQPPPTGWTWHGGALQQAQAAYPEANLEWLDLSTGINPAPWPQAKQVAIDWHRLPERQDLDALEAAAATYYGVAAENICAVPGSEMAMRLCGLMLGGSGQCERLGYRTHREMFADCRLLESYSQARQDQPLIIANPANPSGRILPPHDLLALLAQRPSGWTMIDEAYADTLEGISLAAHISQYPRLILFKSLGKFFGLAGLRLGFVLGSRDWIAAFRHQLGAWPVSAAAIAIGRAALQDSLWITATRTALAARAEQMDDVLQRTDFNASGACPLFRLIDAPDAEKLFDHLCRHAIFTRPFDENRRALRLGVPANSEDFQRLEAALGCA